MVKVWLIEKVMFEQYAQAGEVSKTWRSIQKTIPGRGSSQYQSPEVDACMVYLKTCTEANLAIVKCGKETEGAEVKRWRSGKLAHVCRSLNSNEIKGAIGRFIEEWTGFGSIL